MLGSVQLKKLFCPATFAFGLVYTKLTLFWLCLRSLYKCSICVIKKQSPNTPMHQSENLNASGNHSVPTLDAQVGANLIFAQTASREGFDGEGLLPSSRWVATYDPFCSIYFVSNQFSHK